MEQKTRLSWDQLGMLHWVLFLFWDDETVRLIGSAGYISVLPGLQETEIHTIHTPWSRSRQSMIRGNGSWHTNVWEDGVSGNEKICLSRTVQRMESIKSLPGQTGWNSLQSKKNRAVKKRIQHNPELYCVFSTYLKNIIYRFTHIL